MASTASVLKHLVVWNVWVVRGLVIIGTADNFMATLCTFLTHYLYLAIIKGAAYVL